ncbi:MAG TPA: S41 family peptidase [Burkholderiaceae bacterium]|nr:S41 family peptidase [Burkholderiaceae bacterium]
MRPHRRRRVPTARSRIGLLLAIACFASAAACGSLAAAEKPAQVDWTADFDALLVGLARNYANFEYTLTDRRVDLPGFAAWHRAALTAASSDDERRRAFEQLLRDLRDPHVTIDWYPHKGDEGARVCPAAARSNAGLAFGRLDEYEPLNTNEAQIYSAGLLRRPSAATIGVIRIPIFVEREFQPACKAAARDLGLRTDQPCDESCADKMDRQAAQWLNRALRSTVEALERAGARSLVIDITSNGGGSDWAEVVARMLGGPLQSAQIAMLKHPAWTAFLASQQKAIEAALPGASPADRRRLESAMQTLRKASAETTSGCDLGTAWTDRDLAQGRRALPCSTLIRTSYFATGPERSSAYSGVPTAVDALLFSPARYGEFPTGITSLPLTVMIDRETHSAAEQFAALLRDNGRAIVVGEPSAGAACGTFTDTGTAFVLPSSGARVAVPDCVRLRADGSNERRGIVPDRWVPWAPSDSAYQRARKAADSLLQTAAEPRRP